MGTTVRTVGSKHSRVEEGFVGWFSQTQQQLCDIFPLSTLGRIGSLKPGFPTIQPAVPLRRMASGSQLWHCWRSRYVFVFRAVTELERLFFNVTHVLDRLKVSRYSFHICFHIVYLCWWRCGYWRRQDKACEPMWSLTMLSSAHVRKQQRGKKLSSCFVRSFDACQPRYICQYMSISSTLHDMHQFPISPEHRKSSDNKTSHLHAKKYPEAKALPPASWASVQPSAHAEKQSNGQRPCICSRVASISIISMRGRTHSQKNGENKNSNMIWHWFDYITGAIGIQSKIFQVFKIIASLCLELYKSEKKTGSDHLQFCHQCLCKSSSMDEGNGSLGEKYAIHPRSSSQLLEVMVEMSFLSMYEIYRNMWKISGIVGTQ